MTMVDADGFIQGQVLRCVNCWSGLGPEHRADEATPAVVVAQGRSLCEACARVTPDVVWG